MTRIEITLGSRLMSAAVVAACLAGRALAQCPDDYNWTGCPSFTDESFHGQWPIEAMRVCEVWSRGFTGFGIVVGIVDEGILEYQPDLIGQVEPVEGGCSEARPDNFNEVFRCLFEDQHGTHLA